MTVWLVWVTVACAASLLASRVVRFTSTGASWAERNKLVNVAVTGLQLGGLGAGAWTAAASAVEGIPKGAFLFSIVTGTVLWVLKTWSPVLLTWLLLAWVACPSLGPAFLVTAILIFAGATALRMCCQIR